MNILVSMYIINIDKNIKAMIKLPKKGKVCITHLGGNDKQFVIKVK